METLIADFVNVFYAIFSFDQTSDLQIGLSTKYSRTRLIIFSWVIVYNDNKGGNVKRGSFMASISERLR